MGCVGFKYEVTAVEVTWAKEICLGRFLTSSSISGRVIILLGRLSAFQAFPSGFNFREVSIGYFWGACPMERFLATATNQPMLSF